MSSCLENAGPLDFAVFFAFFFFLALGSDVFPTSKAVVASNSYSNWDGSSFSLIIDDMNAVYMIKICKYSS
jgi:hypothetical protein